MQFAVQENGYTGHAGRRFIYPIRKNTADKRNARLHVLLNAEVTKINFENENDILRATNITVRYLDGSGRSQSPMTFKVNKELIVTAGFYGTPALLLNSGVGPAAEVKDLKMELKGVGRNLHNHQSSLGFPVTFLYGKNYSDVSLKQLFKAFVDGSGRFRMENGVTAVGFDIVTNDKVKLTQSRPNVEYILYYPSASTDNAKRIFVDSAGLDESIFMDTYVNVYGGSLNNPKEQLYATVTLLHSKTRGTVTVNNGKPVIDYQYLTDDDDLETLSLAYARLNRILYKAFSPVGGVLSNKPLKGCETQWSSWLNDSTSQDPNEAVYRPYSDRLDANPSAWQTYLNESVTDNEKEYFKCFLLRMTSSAWHSGGTAKLGSCSSAEDTVVDNRCKVCKTANLRISDASVLPKPISGHNLATLYGITQRCSRMIIEDNKS